MLKAILSLLFLVTLFVSPAKSQALQDATLKDDTTLVVKLLGEGQDVNGVDKNGSTSLMIACRWGKYPMVRLLLEHGAKPDEPKSPKGRTALMIACAYYSGADICGLLIKYGADVNAKAADGTTALMLAAGNGKLAVVELLLAQKAYAPAKDSKGQTALDYANKADIDLIKNSVPDQKLSKEGVVAALKKAMGQ